VKRKPIKDPEGFNSGGRITKYSKDVRDKTGKSVGRICRICSFESATEAEMNNHLRNTHLKDRVKCNFLKCFKIFENKQLLKSHFDMEHFQTAKDSKFK